MGRKYYELLSIDSVDTLRSRMVFKRESSDDSYSMHLENGLIEMKRRMRELIEDGVTFRNCIVTGHGSSGHVKVCSDSITRRVWYDHFYRKGFDRLFPGSNGRLYFAGCNVAEDPHGWAFLAAAARSLMSNGGGSAFGWTSLGFGSLISGHERHFWGDTKAVMVSAGGDTLRYYRNWNLITDAEGNPTLPEEGVDESDY